MLTKKQYQLQNKMFNKIANDIKSLQERAKKDYHDNEDKASYAKGLLIGKSSAYEDSYNLVRKEADEAYRKEPVAIDIQLDNSLNNLEDHLNAIKFIASSFDTRNTEDIYNITNVMEATIKSIKKIINEI
jgi:uncharacterized protein (DUF934 family)